MQYSDDNYNIDKSIHEQWTRTGVRFYKEIPIFVTINKVLFPGLPLHVNDHPMAILRDQYLEPIQQTCQQILYARECLEIFLRPPGSNISAFYVTHYIYDIFSRIISVTDTVALTLRLLFNLSALKDEECALERSKVETALLNLSGNTCASKLGKNLQRARDGWISPFYEVRNLVIHRLESPTAGVFNPDGSTTIGIRLQNPNSGSLNLTPLFTADPRKFNPSAHLQPLADQGDKLAAFLIKIQSNSVRSGTNWVGPAVLCDELWKRLSSLVQDVFSDSYPQIEEYIKANW